MSIAYSSEVACRSIAAREIKSRDFMPLICGYAMDKLAPVAERLIAKGKLPRGEARAVVTNLYRSLKQNEALTGVEAIKLGTKLSDENFMISFMAGATISESQLAIAFGLIVVERRLVAISAHDPLICLHKHAIARYMERTRRGPLDLFKDIGARTRLAATMASFLPDGAGIAIPLSNGILIGTVKVKHSAMYINRADAVNGFYDPELHRLPMPCHFIDVRTFIDADSLGPAKAALFERLSVYAEDAIPELQKTAFVAQRAPESLRKPSLDLFGSREWTTVFSST